jgi:uncharacterized repeat protein (TIGR03803 family)
MDKPTVRGFPFRAAVACVSAALLLAVVATTRAQTYTPLLNFGGGAEVSDLVLSGSILYGTTAQGGNGNNGTVFWIATNGVTFGDCTFMYYFNGGNDDGGTPSGPLILSGSTLYGTTISGGNSYDDGTLFTLAASTNCPTTDYAIVFPFVPWEAQNPYGALILTNTSLFGLTSEGDGTLFTINTDGTGLNNLYVFGGQLTNILIGPFTNVVGGVTNIVGSITNFYSDGSIPNSALLLSGSTLYGTTSSGGSNNLGTIYQINTDGSGYSILHHFSDTPGDGYAPQSGVVLSGSTLYGTTSEGARGNGTVYQINTNGTGFAIMYEFGLVPRDGYDPHGPLTLSGSTLYGTTTAGGSNSCDCGTVFQINTDGTGYQILYDFFGGGFGANPQGTLLLSASTLYGVAGGVLFSMPSVLSTSSPPVTSSVLQITSIMQTGSDMLISWTNSIGTTNALQATTNSVQGTAISDYSTNNFADIFTNIAVTATTNYDDAGAVTNYYSRFYRVRSLP